MDLAKPGLIKRFCGCNALLTFAEYLTDYTDEETQKIGRTVINNQLNEIEDKDLRAGVESKLKEIEAGKRDLYI
jgi:2-iminoacetate synthase